MTIAHVATFEGTREQIDEAIRLLETEVNPVLRRHTGFRDSFFLVDRAEGRALLVTLWESEEAMRVSGEKWGDDPGALELTGGRRTSARVYDVALWMRTDD